ncbi:MAG: zinc-dependent alcohol dehydrogenase family protein [Pseudomonadota bacterium]
MRAMVLDRIGKRLRLADVPRPEALPGTIVVRVLACGVCRTDLHVVDGDLTEPKLPLIPGHEIVGEIVEAGTGVSGAKPGDRVGIPWLGHTCGTCSYCRAGHENLCDTPGFVGYGLDGGYAEYARADAAYCFPLSTALDAVEAAPLMCAGLIGYRSYRMAGDAERLGLYGFGAAAHILIQLARYDGRQIYAFTRPGDSAAQDFARALGAVWAGASTTAPPEPLDAAIIFAPAGPLVPAALKAVRKGGRVVCGGIHMSDIPGFAYDLLWEERSIRSVANLTRQDGLEFLPLAEQAGIRTEVHAYPLEAANEALEDLRQGRFTGAAVLVP